MKQLEAADPSLTNKYACSNEPPELKASIFPDEQELQKKLVKLPKMLLSSCAESVLSLRAEEKTILKRKPYAYSLDAIPRPSSLLPLQAVYYPVSVLASTVQTMSRTTG